MVMQGLTEDEVRAINLIEILQDEAEENGDDIQPPPASASSWSLEDIRKYFATKGQWTPSAVQNGAASAIRLKYPNPEVFNTWFPGLKRSGTQVEGTPKGRVVCFPNAGNAEDMYTSEGTGVRRATSPLLEWCRDNKVECLSPQYPGRAMRMKEERITRASAMAEALFPVLAPYLMETSWILVAHSVGTWISYEFLLLCQKHGVPMPQKAYLSAMAAPNIPFEDRPWRQQRHLSEEEFKDECREWDISEVVFSPTMWPTYEPLLRADFTLFDEYEHPKNENTKLSVPIHAFWGTKDRRIKEHHVMGWSAFTSKTFQIEKIEGNHLWPLDKTAKTTWLQKIVDSLEQL